MDNLREVTSVMGVRMGMIPGAIAGGAIRLTESEWEALTEYVMDATYEVEGVGTYLGPNIQSYAEWTYDPADIHVAKTGNDTTGDGSYENPYLTIKKAYDILVTAGSGRCWVREGTYAENTGGGYFNKGTTFSSRTVIQAVPGDNVVWTNVSGNYVIYLTNSSNLTIRGFKIQTNSTPIAFLNVNTTVNGLQLIECNFDDNVGTTANAIRQSLSSNPVNCEVKRCTFTSSGGLFSPSGMVLSSNYKFIGNTVNIFGGTSVGAAGSGLLYVNSNTVTNTNGSGFAIGSNVASLNLTFKRNVVNVSGNGFIIKGGTSGFEATIAVEDNQITCSEYGVSLREYINAGTIKDNIIHVSTGDVGIGAPYDSGDVGLVENLVISGNRITGHGVTFHATLLSVKSSNITYTNNVSDARGGGKYGIVIKGSGHTITYNTFYGGSSNGIYFKGAHNCTVQNNTTYQYEGGDGLFFGDQAGDNPSGNTVTKNNFYIQNGELYSTGPIGAGNVVDYNGYYISPGSTLGDLLNSVALNSLADIQARWITFYGGVPNDANSTVTFL